MNECVDRALNINELYFVNTYVSVKYNKYISYCCFFSMTVTALGESLITKQYWASPCALFATPLSPTEWQ